MSPEGEKGPPVGAARSARKAGFTLVEVMVATVLLTVMFLSILQTLIFSYQVAAKARYHDAARFVIRSFADQFMTQDSTVNQVLLTMFTPTMDSSNNYAPLGTGLSWVNPDGSNGTLVNGLNGLSSYQVLIAAPGQTPITATVTRGVQYVSPTSGDETLSDQNAAAGYFLEGDFTISYTFDGQAQTPLTITAVRSIP
ncbi:MAG TPA: prepilin-type N-terminal cleavage/methylation domain-containing protein [Opitutaceae bacterium]|jgi:prepilin-type N-terminal cleavage/methylation domain-containing protein